MWYEKSALSTVESYFRKDERFQTVCKLPWFYAFSKKILLFLALSIAFTFVLLFSFPDPPLFVQLVLWILGFAWLYFASTRAIFGNYAVITQYTVYRYINKSIQQIDEIPLSEAKIISVSRCPLFTHYAIVSIRCRKAYTRAFPGLKRLYDLKNAQQNPEKADMRTLSLGKPTQIRLVLKNPRETYMIFSDIKTIMGYPYLLCVKGKKYVKRK